MNFYVGDFETVTAESDYFKQYNETNLIYGYLKGFHGIDYEFNNIANMFEFLSNAYFNNNDYVKVYFHNLSFDGVFILDWLGVNNFIGVNEEIPYDTKKRKQFFKAKKIKDNKVFNVFRQSGSHIYSIDVNYLNYDNKNILISFVCSWNILGSSVEKLGEALVANKKYKGIIHNKFSFVTDINQLDDFYKINPVNDINLLPLNYRLYCQNDVKIVFYSLLEHYNELINQFGCKNKKKQAQLTQCLTNASTTLSLAKLVVNDLDITKDGWYVDCNEREIQDKFTNGGLTIVNRLYNDVELRGDFICIDINSAYPSIMVEELPYGSYSLDPYPNCKNICFIEVRCKKLFHREYVSINLIKNFDDSLGILYHNSAEEFTGYYLEEEWDYLCEYFLEYNECEIVNRYYYKVKSYLKNYIESLYSLKNNHKKLKNKSSEHTYKILMNSLYGKFATRSDFNVVLFEYDLDKSKYIILDHYDLNKKDRHSYIPNNKLFVCSELEKREKYFNKAIANYITAKVRLKIYQAIVNIGINHFIYCDTDSIFLYGKNKKDIIDYCGDQLGKWKIEFEIKNGKGIFKRPKTYVVMDKNEEIVKFGLAGVSQDALSKVKWFESGTQTIDKAYKVSKRVKNGLVIVDVDKELNFENEE